MKRWMAAAVLLWAALPAAAHIETLYPLQQFIVESDVIAEGTIEKVDPKFRIFTVRITKSIKGRCHYEILKINLGTGQAWHPDAALPHLVAGAPAVIFYNAERRAEIYVNRFFLQLSGDPGQPPEKAWWAFSHIEVRCNRTFNGTAEELSRLLFDVQAGKVRPPRPEAEIPAITKESMKALPRWGQPASADALPAPFTPPDPARRRKVRDAENPPGLVKGLIYQYYEGDWKALPDFDALKPAAEGISSCPDLADRKREGRYGLRFSGYIDIPREGSYTFQTGSVGGSKLLIGSEEVVSNDGVHGLQEIGGDILLKGGRHSITVLYFQNGAGGALDVRWEGPDLPRQKVPSAALYHLPPP